MRIPTGITQPLYLKSLKYFPLQRRRPCRRTAPAQIAVVSRAIRRQLIRFYAATSLHPLRSIYPPT